MSLLERSNTYNPQYDELVNLTKLHEKAHWGEHEVKLQSDIEQWKTGVISDEDKYFINSILRFFTQGDKNVAEEYYEIFIPAFKNNEARNWFGSVAGREGTHQRAYALLSDTLGAGEGFYEEFLNYKSMVDKNAFMLDMSNKSNKDIALSLVKQCLLEGVSLFATFAMLLNYSRDGLMMGMSDANQWSIRDESIHFKGNCWLLRQFLKEHPRLVNDAFKKAAYALAQEVIRLEDAFIDECFKLKPTQGSERNRITKEQVKQYARSVCDFRMEEMGFKAQYNVANPFRWLDWVTNPNVVENFFETNTTSYSKDSMVGTYEEGY